jgi:hypothetical protein
MTRFLIVCLCILATACATQEQSALSDLDSSSRPLSREYKVQRVEKTEKTITAPTATATKVSIDGSNVEIPQGTELKVVVPAEKISNGKLTVQTLLGQYLQAKQNAIRSNAPKTDGEVRNDTNRAEHVSTYVSYGVALSDMYCTDLFSRQFFFEREVDHIQRNIRLTGDLALAGIGLRDSTAPSAVAGWALAFSGLDRYQENYKQTYFLSNSAVEAVERKLKEARKLNADALKLRSSGLNVEEAESLISEYHNTCSRKGIRNLITQSVELAEYQPNSQAPDVTELNLLVTNSTNGIKAQSLSKSISDELGFGDSIPLPLDYLRAIYSQAFYASSGVAAHEKSVTNPYKTYVEKFNQLNGDTEKKSVIDKLSELNIYLNLADAHENVEKEFQASQAKLPNDEARAEKSYGDLLNTVIKDPLLRAQRTIDLGIRVLNEQQH